MANILHAIIQLSIASQQHKVVVLFPAVKTVATMLVDAKLYLRTILHQISIPCLRERIYNFMKKKELHF
ncbi:MAG: hypothetical protein LBK03_05685 [Bacteroidales bacterium]|jgi:hypothetical protein|nr:hypothetical protein [Bacteroidales bacterium]